MASPSEGLPPKDLMAVQGRIARTLAARWWAPPAEHPATLRALVAFNGGRKAVHEWMTSPHRPLGGATLTEPLQTPEGLQEVLCTVLRIEPGGSSSALPVPGAGDFRVRNPAGACHSIGGTRHDQSRAGERGGRPRRPEEA